MMLLALQTQVGQLGSASQDKKVMSPEWDLANGLSETAACGTLTAGRRQSAQLPESRDCVELPPVSRIVHLHNTPINTYRLTSPSCQRHDKHVAGNHP